MSDLILASRSPARAKLLVDAGIPVCIRPSPLDEAKAKIDLIAERLSPCELAKRLASAKALALEAHPDEVILGADQTLDLDGEVFDKPGNVENLRCHLERLQGREHRLHAAAVLVRGGHLIWTGHATVTLRMRPLRTDDLDRYVDVERHHVLDCVGGYRLEGSGVRLFEAIDGEYFAVLGLPLLGLLAALRGIGIGL